MVNGSVLSHIAFLTNPIDTYLIVSSINICFMYLIAFLFFKFPIGQSINQPLRTVFAQVPQDLLTFYCEYPPIIRVLIRVIYGKLFSTTVTDKTFCQILSPDPSFSLHFLHFFLHFFSHLLISSLSRFIIR